MSKPIKAALLSVLVFPGTGHFYLRKPLTGTVLALAALGSLYLLASKALERALQIAEKIQSGEIPLDVATIKELVTVQPTGADAWLVNIATAVLVISWLLGIVDSYRVGRSLAKKESITE